MTDNLYFEAKQRLADTLGLGYVSELTWDAYTQLRDNWDQNVLESLTPTQLRRVLENVQTHFDWQTYFNQIDEHLVSALAEQGVSE